ncbi:MAG: inorganic phosphate transporter [Chitinophagales bacterium]
MELLIVVIVLALLFDYINGFHDAANSIATVVSTKVLSPFQAVVWAAFFNAVVFFLCKHHLFGFELKVADAVSKIVKTEAITLVVIISGLLAAIAWNLFTWYYGIPSSSSHTLMGGFAGAAMAKAGFGVLADVGKIYTTMAFIVLAPLMGMLLAYFISILILHACKSFTPSKADRWFRRLQLVSSAAFSLGHGANDAQKVMGIIAAALLVVAHSAHPETIPSWAQVEVLEEIKNGHILYKVKHIPDWVQIGCFMAIGLGTLSGGWRIIKTMGSKITKVTPLEGVAAETAGAITLYATQALGIPVSTTHTITGSIIGVGLTKRMSAVRWGVTINILWAWILTIPASALMGSTAYFILRRLLGE